MPFVVAIPYLISYFYKILKSQGIKIKDINRLLVETEKNKVGESINVNLTG